MGKFEVTFIAVPAVEEFWIHGLGQDTASNCKTEADTRERAQWSSTRVLNVQDWQIVVCLKFSS